MSISFYGRGSDWDAKDDDFEAPDPFAMQADDDDEDEDEEEKKEEEAAEGEEKAEVVKEEEEEKEEEEIDELKALDRLEKKLNEDEIDLDLESEEEV